MTNTAHNGRRTRLMALVCAVSIVVAACGGGEEAEPFDCGRDDQTGARSGWTDLASQCFRAAYLAGEPAVAQVVETREGVGLATVNYTTDGSDTYTRQVIPSGGLATVFHCEGLGAATEGGKVQLNPRDCTADSG